ncbi:Protein disulfide-isomerase [Aphelenchoides fujianensis]|nr:Protein disulfide-isomerase [Aphelenchoides fujianensis]
MRHLLLLLGEFLPFHVRLFTHTLSVVSVGVEAAGGKSKVVELTDSNFERTVYNQKNGFLVEFFAPWCGHCKNLEPHWKAAAEQLDGKVSLGALDATVHTSKSNEFGIRGFPTIKYFPPGSTSASDAVEYNGGRSTNDIVQWALAKAAENLPPPELKQATSKKVVKEACDEKQLCIIAFLPPLLDCQSKCRNEYLNMLKDQVARFKKSPWGWLWAEAGEQPKLEEAFEIGGFGYPAMVAANSRKLKRASASSSAILSYGRGKTSTIRGTEFPEAQKVNKWDGKDAEPPVVEEIDLSDVELDDLEDLKKRSEL